ncbi:MAG TPA: carboxymuconolactone decarboxylase family protein [Steroidobacteraceae bacterium]|nr:carboxymuconolactone decarboxylase family protein [Steroidobacteraceae bacterium]
MNDRSEGGFKIFGELMGTDAAQALRAATESSGFAAGIGRLAVDFCFADIWARDGLDRKQRSLVTIAILIAMRQSHELKNHVRIAVRNGLTVRELEEVLFQSLPYVGFPAVATATTQMLETLRDLGLETGSKTSEEQGLL